MSKRERKRKTWLKKYPRVLLPSSPWRDSVIWGTHASSMRLCRYQRYFSVSQIVFPYLFLSVEFSPLSNLFLQLKRKPKAMLTLCVSKTLCWALGCSGARNQSDPCPLRTSLQTGGSTGQPSWEANPQVQVGRGGGGAGPCPGTQPPELEDRPQSAGRGASSAFCFPDRDQRICGFSSEFLFR